MGHLAAVHSAMSMGTGGGTAPGTAGILGPTCLSPYGLRLRGLGYHLAPKCNINIMGMEPRETLEVEGETVKFLLDMEAAFLVLKTFSGSLCSASHLVVGVDGKLTHRWLKLNLLPLEGSLIFQFTNL